ncbi:MAG: 4-hydroxy-3-methylbut-2-enyl diphosphate reductase [Patescibacteria group bacterium]|nr:4-hydroxy-3-methylbut-2-enyl diphosphate reductase [Patescibacteria group bacterium]
MKITISKFAGFCQGAKRAYDISINSAKKNNKNLYILGDLLHNKHVSDKIKSLGIKKIESTNKIKKGSIIISAHGVSKSIIQEAEKKALNIINTTCPKVIKVQQIVKKYYLDNIFIFIFGDKNHKEVRGINGWCDNNATIISDIKEIKNIDFSKIKNAVIVSQTTQELKKFLQIVKFLRKKIKNLKIFNTICDATKNRQEEAKKISAENDAIIVIGGKKSANSKKLFKIAKENNKNVFFVNSASEINLKNFSDFKKIGITAGASTPDCIIKNVCKKLKTLKTL